MSNWGILQALVFEPRKAFAEIGERPRSLFPLLLLVVVSASLVLWYYQVVDLAWLADQQLRNSPFAAQMTEAQIEAGVSQAVANPVRNTVVTVLATAFGVLLIRLLEALYYLLAGKLTNVQRSFRQWFALACWTSLPSLLAVIPAAIVLATATTSQIDQAALQSLSLNALLFHRVAGDPGYSLFTSINLLQIVGLGLAAFGVRIWSGRSWLFGIVFTILPWALILGGWAFFALGRS